MSLCVSDHVTNNHAPGLLGWVTGHLQVWFERWRERTELTRWSDRDLRDAGWAWSDVVREAEKPFWRA